MIVDWGSWKSKMRGRWTLRFEKLTSLYEVDISFVI